MSLISGYFSVTLRTYRARSLDAGRESELGTGHCVLTLEAIPQRA